jgi:hypothetical protein
MCADHDRLFPAPAMAEPSGLVVTGPGALDHLEATETPTRHFGHLAHQRYTQRWYRCREDPQSHREVFAHLDSNTVDLEANLGLGLRPRRSGKVRIFQLIDLRDRGGVLGKCGLSFAGISGRSLPAA